MFRRSALAPALVSALTGCVSAPPKGPFVEYHDGAVPVTREVTCAATYALHASENPAVPITEHRVANGERIGFRREPDGSVVAVGPGYTLALAAGAYSWDVIPGSVSKWRRLVPTFAGRTPEPLPGATVEYGPGKSAETCEVPYPATYVLCAVTPEGNESEPLLRTGVERRDHVGFVRQPDGTLAAYAGGLKFPLAEGRYVWRIAPETQRTRNGLVGERVGLGLGVMGQALQDTATSDFAVAMYAELVRAILAALASGGR